MVNLTDKVGELEVKMEVMQEGVEAMRGEVQRMEKNVVIMLNQFAYMRSRWEEQVRESKNKGKEREQLGEFRGVTRN